MSTHQEHIVVLKKIPVDPRHVGALRIGKDVEHHAPRRKVSPLADDRSSSPHVASTKVYQIFSFILFFAFLINPIGVAYAAEVTPLPDVPAEVPSEPQPEEIQPGVTIVVPPDAPAQEGSPETVPPADDTDEGSPVPADENPPTPDAGGGDEGAASTTDEEIVPVGEDATTTATSTDTESSSGGDGSSGTTTDITLGDVGTSTEGTSTEESIVPEEEQPETVLDREQTPEERAAEKMAAEAVMREQIKKEVEAEMRAKCVSYGGDGYYCLDESSEKRITSQSPVEQVISAPDPSGGGDKEIVLIKTLPEGESRTPITVNDIDDEFPSADGALRMIVWQSLVEGRWQIAYKEEGKTIEYLTANSDGNGHPATDGKRIVWQGWSGDDWDIFIAEPSAGEVSFSGTTTSELQGIHPGWKVTRLSDNDQHDMFPKIAGNFVTWQEHRGGSWVVAVYDLTSGAMRTIEGDAGGTGEAPVVALIFKERTKDGQIFIRASDLATGQRIPLRDDEVPPPAKLPIPEQSGALPLQNGTSSVTSIRADGDGDGGVPEV